ncbi:MAG: NAD+ synthase [Alistipes sp.]|jgi:NAD+ synthase (glutamine-hydrolysing)|nr:NAD+ synthase [Alistipes sp.]
MKIAACQLNYTIGDFEGNKLKIIDHISRAKAMGADLVVFAQGAISGTPGYDLLRKYSFLEHAEEALIEIASHCDDISVLVGLPIQGKGGTVSAAAHIHNRRIERFIGKKNIPSREEKPYLVPGSGVKYVRVASQKVAVVIGEDITLEQEWSPNTDVIVSLTAHSYSRGIVEKRYNHYSRLAHNAGHPTVYVNQVGGQTDVLFDGSSAAFNGRGEAICLLKNFEEDFRIIDTEAADTVAIPPQDKTANVYCAMKMGLADYFRKNGFTRACLGMSGGIDSAVVAAIAGEALGAQNVRLLMMPSQFSTEHSVDDAVDMAERMGSPYDVVPITETYKAVTETMIPVVGGTRFDVTEENVQSRIRGVMLMALSNKFGHIVLNCSNKSENAVGYGTLYGDSIGSISMAGDLYKCEIYDLARHINKVRESEDGRKGGVIPENILLKEPSAELHPGQLDSDRLPSYDVLDAILYRMIEEGQNREEIINAGFDAPTVNRVHKMLLRNEYKRRQGCPVFRLSTAPLGKEFIMPLTNEYGGYGF